MEEVANFTYLGSFISSNGDAERDVICLVFQHLSCSNDFVQSGTCRHSLCRLNCSSCPRLLCQRRPMHARPGRWQKPSLQVWTFSTSDVCDTSSRSLTGTMLRTWKYTDAPTHTISVTFTECCFHFVGQILRLPNHRILKMAIFWWPAQGKWKQGCPKITWQRTFMEGLQAFAIPWDEAEVMAADRSHWRMLTALCAEQRRWN